jgi:hypothetical protein
MQAATAVMAGEYLFPLRPASRINSPLARFVIDERAELGGRAPMNLQSLVEQFLHAPPQRCTREERECKGYEYTIAFTQNDMPRTGLHQLGEAMDVRSDIWIAQSDSAYETDSHWAGF